MSLFNSEKEMQCILNWFLNWNSFQRGEFMKQLVDKAVPSNVDSLFDAMNSLNVKDKPPTIFQCQLKLFDQWFDEWSVNDRQDLLLKIHCIDPEFVRQFNENTGNAM